MKKILFLLLFFPFVLNGQSRKISELGVASSVTGTELIPIVQGGVTKSVTPATLNDSTALTGIPTAPTAVAGTNTTQIATTAFVKAADDLKLNVTNPTAIGTLTTPILKVGNASSNTITSLDSISKVTGATDINFFDGADTLNPRIPFAKRVDITTVAVMQDDSAAMLEDYINKADTSVFLREAELKSLDDYFNITMTREGADALYVLNHGNATLSTAIKGQVHGEINTPTYGINTAVSGVGSSSGTGMINVGLYGAASGSSYLNWAAWIDGDLKLSGDFVSTPVNTGDIVAGTGITLAMLSHTMLYNGSSAIDISASPQISTYASNGMKICIIGLSDANTLKLDDGTGLQLAAGASITLGSGDTIELIYIETKDLWIEIGRSDN